MRIKKYRAVTMQEALFAIKKDLGDEAMILKTERIPKKMFGLGDKATVEVTAAIDDTLQPQTSSIKAAPIRFNTTGTYDLRRNNSLQRPEPARPDPYPKVVNPQKNILTEKFHILELREELLSMKKLLASILATGESSAAGGFAGPWAILYKRLIDSEIKQSIAEELISKLKNTTEAPDKNINNDFFRVLTEHFPVAGKLLLNDHSPQVIALVGPTGAGKTTTLAKLAAYYSLNENKQVSIITADTYRIAAIEQIRAFADIVNIGLQVIFSPDEVSDALLACENDDIVFIDTAGRSPRNKEHMADLELFIEKMRPDQIHLVMSATTKDYDLIDTIKRYKDINVNRLIFTKLDETGRLGNIFNVVSKSAIPVSYLTLGQSVPDDIEIAQAGRFIKRLLKGSSL